MKKFISMVMAAAMVVSLVPATAFAANAGTAKVVGALEWTEAEAKDNKDTVVIDGPQIQVKIKDVDQKAGVQDDFDLDLDFANAELKNDLTKGTFAGVVVRNQDFTNPVGWVSVAEDAEAEDTTVSVKVVENYNNEDNEDAEKSEIYDFENGDLIVVYPKNLGLVMTKATVGAKATVEVSGDFCDSDAMTLVTVLKEGIKVTLKKVATVAAEEVTNLESKMTIEANVGTFADDQVIELKLNSGFEWSKADASKMDGVYYAEIDENVLTLLVADVDTITIPADAVEIDAVSAKVGDVAKVTVKAKKDSNVPGSFAATAEAVDAAKVIGEEVTISVDEDEDVPVIYSGVSVENYGINDDSDHVSLEVTIEESVAGALNVKQALELGLPEGVFVTDVDVTDDSIDVDGAKAVNIEHAFAKAYEKAEYEGFTFVRKTFVETKEAGKLVFTLTLVAEPGFEGDVVLTMGDQEVTIAKFVAPYKVEAQQNDLIIDYRYTDVPTDIVVKEAEAGLWDKDAMAFNFNIEKFGEGAFEKDATFTVDKASEMEVKALYKDSLGFEVKEESDDAAATVTISNISLYMGRNLAAGAYDLELYTSAAYAMWMEELFTTEVADCGDFHAADAAGTSYAYREEHNIDPVIVKEGFVNIITAGRDQDDASFTKKVVVPVGESYIIAGEEKVALDVPAYISAAGYTMLPVRAVAVALGINTHNILWDQATKTVTILYGQRIITMQAGSKVIYVNGNAIPASATVEIKDGRTFLPMRDLATALGVTDITWDAATKTATLNGGNQK